MASSKEVVLVTGGSGLVGRCLQQRLSSLEYDDKTRARRFIFLSSRDANLTLWGETKRIFEEYKPNHVIHLAAKVGGLYANLDDTDGLFYKLNRELNENVLKLSFQFGVERCISCLSTCIFPDQIEYPLDESKVHLGPPHDSNRGYALAKRQIDELNQHYNAQMLAENKTGLFFSIIPTNIFGPFDNFHLDDSHVVPGLIHRAYRACISQQQQQQQQKTLNETPIRLRVKGSGKPLRQFLYGPDLAELILWSLDEFLDASEPRIIICPGDEVSIGEVAALICGIFSEKFKLDLKPEFDASKSDGQFRKTASNGKLRRLHGQFKFTPLEVGLRETIAWFCAHYPHVRGATDIENVA